MKNKCITGLTLVVIALVAINSQVFAESFKSQSLGGTTGLISTPTAWVAWNDPTLQLDFGYHLVNDDRRDETHLPKVSATIMGQFEIGATYDKQDSKYDSDYLLHAKFQFYGKGSGSALAVGANTQFLRHGIDTDNDGSNDDDELRRAHQLYLAVTYPGNIISMPVESTLVVGKTFGKKEDGINRHNIDVSIGFDLDFIPSIFKSYVHLICDFANYSYSMEGYGTDAFYRGVFNAGLRIAAIKPGKYKLNFDALLLDGFDSNRGWALGVNFGMPIF